MREKGTKRRTRANGRAASGRAGTARRSTAPVDGATAEAKSSTRARGGHKSEIASRLAEVRRKMAEAGVDALLVRSTDRYLNEYVPIEDSSRVWISGFTGSMGEVVIAKDRAYLAVDGRYHLQADRETDPAL